MLLTITTTHEPATDLGFLLHKHPNRALSAELPFGTVKIFYPESSPKKCTVAILLDINPIELVRGKQGVNASVPLEQYVNDRPYVCSSFMSVALARIFGQTLNGRCKQKPELVQTKMPLTCNISALPCQGGEKFLRRLFEPLGYRVKLKKYDLDKNFPQWGQSNCYSVEISKKTTVVELFNNLYILIPVLDNYKHYYIDKNEIEKLLKRGADWLGKHPERENIARRYLKYRRSFAQEAIQRLIEENDEKNEPAVEISSEEQERAVALNDQRYGSVISALKSANSKKIVDLGCGEGKLLKLLFQEKQFEKILGMDVSVKSLEIASERLHLDKLPTMQKQKIDLIHGSLTYRDKRLEGFDAATLVEVIEHLDPPRLKAMERVVFECAHPQTVVLTTPNKEYNVLWPNVGSKYFRHKDHRFEWTRQQFKNWADKIAENFGYKTRYIDIGPVDKKLGAPTQMCVFTRQSARKQ